MTRQNEIIRALKDERADLREKLSKVEIALEAFGVNLNGSHPVRRRRAPTGSVETVKTEMWDWITSFTLDTPFAQVDAIRGVQSTVDFHVSSGTASRALDLLEREGLIEPDRPRTHGSRALFSVTEKGRNR